MGWLLAQQYSNKIAIRALKMSRALIVTGTILVALGLLWPIIAKLGLGRLPGDIVIERESVKFYAPITTSILLSIVISTVLWMLQR